MDKKVEFWVYTEQMDDLIGHLVHRVDIYQGSDGNEWITDEAFNWYYKTAKELNQIFNI